MELKAEVRRLVSRNAASESQARVSAYPRGQGSLAGISPALQKLRSMWHFTPLGPARSLTQISLHLPAASPHLIRHQYDESAFITRLNLIRVAQTKHTIQCVLISFSRGMEEGEEERCDWDRSGIGEDL
jgi:hypothetical protein